VPRLRCRWRQRDGRTAKRPTTTPESQYTVLRIVIWMMYLREIMMLAGNTA
jgi:hypothetical protein